MGENGRFCDVARSIHFEKVSCAHQKSEKIQYFKDLVVVGLDPLKFIFLTTMTPKKHILLFYHCMVTPVMQRCRTDFFHSKIGQKSMILFFAHQMGERIVLAIKVGLAGILIISAV